MLRLTVLREDSQEVVVQVEGWLEGSQVKIMMREGERWRGRGRRLVLEVDGLKQVDENGLALLRSWTGDRLEVRGGSAFLRALIEQTGGLYHD